MSELAERSEWYRGKEPIIEEYVGQRSGFLAATAARGFPNVPGVLIKGLNALEMQTKKALSTLNYEITAQAIERDLAQSGLDYTLAYKGSTTLWEIEKATLLDTLTRELADCQKVREDQEHVLANLAIEVGLRQVALINAKAVLEVESEELKKQIVETQERSLPYETQLAQEKLATAQRKLLIIPHLQALIDAEESLIAEEEANAALTESLINARVDQIPIKEGLIGLKGYLITAKDALTAPLLSVADKKLALADARHTYEEQAQGKIAPSNTLATTMGQLNAALQVYINKRGELVDPYMERATKMAELINPSDEYAKALLETIPYIQALALERQRLIAPGLAKAEALRSLLSPLISKAEKTLEYAGSLERQAETEVEIKEIAESIEGLRRDGVDADIAVMSEKLKEGDFQKALVEANVILKQLSENNRADLLDQEAKNTIEYATAKETEQSSVLEIEKKASRDQLDSKTTVSKTKIASRYDSVRTTVGARAGVGGSIRSIASIHGSEREATAKIAAAAKITSNLVHQLS